MNLVSAKLVAHEHGRRENIVKVRSHRIAKGQPKMHGPIPACYEKAADPSYRIRQEHTAAQQEHRP